MSGTQWCKGNIHTHTTESDGDAERSSQALRALDAATVIEPQRLPEVIEGDHADNPVLPST